MPQTVAQREYQRRWRQSEGGREKIRAAQRRYATSPGGREKIRVKSRQQAWNRYGIQITYEEYTDMFAAQGGRCAICARLVTLSAHVDHDHGTGRFRGILCRGCNLGIGNLQDDPRLLRSAADYLEGLRWVS